MSNNNNSNNALPLWESALCVLVPINSDKGKDAEVLLFLLIFINSIS